MKKFICLVTLLLLFSGCGKACKTDETKEIGIISTKVIEDKKIPEFNIKVKGEITSIINEEVVKKLNVYEIKALVDDEYSKCEKTYTGIKLKDALKEVTDYTKFISYISDNDKKTSGYVPNDIDDNMFIIFRDNNKVDIIKFDRKTYNWIRNASEIDLSESYK